MPSGDCFTVALALQQSAQHRHFNPILVHGIVTGQAQLDGVRYWHAWVEVGEVVHDFSNDKRLTMPRPMYYRIGKIEPEQTWRYNLDRALNMALNNDTYGPWVSGWETMAS